jgi:succinyl-CoA synthetase beta subunit
MNLHEYQGKALFAEYGLPVSNSKVVYEAEDAHKACRDIGGSKWVVKAQVHAGGRGKAGGVELVDSPEDAISFAKKWLGKRLVTYQTDSNGQLVNSILIEECTDISEELYLSAVIDRDSQRVVFIGSSEGGVNIEDVAKNSPEKIIYEPIDPLCGAQGFQARKIAKVLKLNTEQTKQFTPMLKNLMKLFVEKDLSLLEINPLVITSGGMLHCLDAKINIDSNALYRQPEIAEMHDPSQEDPRESEASKNDLSYVSLDGNIGCMVNGAGLAMGTMDIIQLHGGSPANFLDVGGGATKERVAKAFSIILQDPNVKVILVNIFGGIMKCDIIAEGVVAAAKGLSIQVPLVVRLEGTNVDLGKEILNKSGLAIISADNLEDAAQKAVGALS